MSNRSIEKLHPYLGYVLNPGSTESDWARYGWPKPEIDFMGFEGANYRLAEGSAGPRVAIVGGSVAKALCQQSGQTVLDHVCRLSESQEAGTLCCLSLGGYKQPQQLMAVTYMLMLGAQYDVVINLDGFNEVALFPAEDGGRGTCPSFPRVWFNREPDVLERGQIELIGELSFWRSALDQNDSRHGSRVGRLPKMFSSETVEQRIADLEQQFRNYVPSRTQLNASLFSTTELYDSLGRIWYSSSLQLHLLLTANNARYFHFLQPNQYVKGSKPLNKIERASAYDESHPYREGVSRGYPVLRDLGTQLVGKGVKFKDLTQLFRGSHDTIYMDTCCHFTQTGNDAIAASIAATLEQLW